MTGGPCGGYRFEMALTRAEFLRLLPVAVGQLQLSVEGECIAGRTHDVEWTIRIIERPERRIAGLTLPTLEVMLDCAAADRHAVQRFFEQFMRAYQRAGG